MKRFTAMIVLLLLLGAMAFAGGTQEGAAAATAGATVDNAGVIELYATPADYEKATGKQVGAFKEAPMLEAMVTAGELPPLDQRLPREPLVIKPRDSVGSYGGTLRAVTHIPLSGADIQTTRAQRLVAP
jgi:hypothetical protein